MNGPLAQIVALTCHANAFLQGKTLKRFFPENSTCSFCDSISFVKLKSSLTGKIRETLIAPSPDEWFRYLKGSGVTDVLLSWKPQNREKTRDRMTAGFVGGGGTWTMEVLLPKKRGESWEARWEVWNQKAPDQRIWRVTYAQISQGATAEVEIPNLSDIKEQLARSLQDIHSFSSRHRLDGFTRTFSDALNMLSGNAGFHSAYYNDLAPENFLSEKAEVILDACQRSWVFGGMGSWNDMGFKGDEQDRYETVSEQLFQTLTEAIQAAANSGSKGGQIKN